MKFQNAILLKQAKLGKIITRAELAKMVEAETPGVKCSVHWIERLLKPSHAGKVKPSPPIKAAIEKVLECEIEF